MDNRRQSNLEVRECLTTALVRLSESKPLSAITVTELCEMAGVSRMSFYRNYQSKEDILSAYLTEKVDEYHQQIIELNLQDEPCYGLGHLTFCFAFFKENRDFITCLFNFNCAGMFVAAVSDYILDTWNTGDALTEYALTSFAGAICTIYVPWAHDGFNREPGAIAAIINGLFDPRSRVSTPLRASDRTTTR